MPIGVVYIQILKDKQDFAFETAELKKIKAIMPETAVFDLDNFSDETTISFLAKFVDEFKELVVFLDFDKAPGMKTSNFLQYFSHYNRPMHCYFNDPSFQKSPLSSFFETYCYTNDFSVPLRDYVTF